MFIERLSKFYGQFGFICFMLWPLRFDFSRNFFVRACDIKLNDVVTFLCVRHGFVCSKYLCWAWIDLKNDARYCSIFVCVMQLHYPSGCTFCSLVWYFF